jgi:hypothetical protein
VDLEPFQSPIDSALGFQLARLSQLAVKHPSNGRISGGVVSQGRHHRMDGDYAIGMPSRGGVARKNRIMSASADGRPFTSVLA